MCGLAGILGEPPAVRGLLSAMADSLAHRGPDDSGIWADEASGIGLAHRRLSIVDVTPLGHQPMASNDGRYIIAYNGEIYNHLSLRAELDAMGSTNWRGHSDTETLIECIAAWGLQRTLQRSVGMFALALWDRRERLLRLARDRFGEKPLYYGWVGGDFVFGSELKALRRHPKFDNVVDRRALGLFTSRAYIPAPFSIYERIFKLEPASILTVAIDAARSPTTTPPVIGGPSGAYQVERFWSYRDVVVSGLANPVRDEREALEQLEAVLCDAIEGQSVADVPVGAFLSGGIDSSTLVALYQKLRPGKVKTFTIGFEEDSFNEAPFAKQLARHLGTEHHEQYVSFRDAAAIIPNLPAIYDEPFADSSQLPIHLVCKMARDQVTVCLSGDGGDELFGGYNRYFGTIRLWTLLKHLPLPLRTSFGRAMAMIPPVAWNAFAGLLLSGLRPDFFGTRVQKTFNTIGHATHLQDFVGSFLDEWASAASPVMYDGPLLRDGLFDVDLGNGAPDVARMMYCDAVSYLPDDILCKVDRAAMAVSLETRVPFLDHRVAEFAARIPMGMKIQGGAGKIILRKLLYQHAPREMLERPKAGFAIPIGEWLRGPLRPWAEEMLEPGRMREQGFFEAAIVQKRWRSHLSGERDSTQAIWTVLMFQAWLAQERAAH